jgi:acetyltransferase-like isoleucine patch superfamily enzyme
MMSDRDKIAYDEASKQLGISRIRFAVRFAKNWVLERLASSFPIPSWRVALHRLRGIHIGKNVYIGYDVIFDRIHPELITVEDFAEIGDRCIISAHSRGSLLLIDAYPRQTRSVRIGRGAWIAPGCIIIQGVTIGERAVIGTGSVVTKSIPSKSVAVGVPARVIKAIAEESPEKVDLDNSART